MKQLKSILAITATALIFSACNNGNDKTMIKGTASGTEEITMLEMQGRQTDTIGVLTLSGEDASFSKEIKTDSLRMIFLMVSEQFNVPLMIKPGDQVELEIDATTPQGTYSVSGSEESERLEKIMDITAHASGKVDSLSQMLSNAQDSAGFSQMRAQLDQAYQGLVAEAGGKLKAMIDEKPGSMANIYIFTQSIGQRPIISVQENFDYLEKVADGISENYPNHSITRSFQQDVEKVRKQQQQSQKMNEVKESVSAGTQAPDISLPNPDGEVMKLSELRGKVVLVDFWAAWCKPCRMENPNLVRIYNKYKDEGFTVYSVSLDGLPQQQNPEEQWKKAIEEDGLTWDTHVSDLKGWKSAVVPKFGFQGIPYTVLIDREGKIIATELRGKQLEDKLAEVFGQS